MKKLIYSTILATAVTASAYTALAVVASEEAAACYRGFIWDRRCHQQ